MPQFGHDGGFLCSFRVPLSCVTVSFTVHVGTGDTGTAAFAPQISLGVIGLFQAHIRWNDPACSRAHVPGCFSDSLKGFSLGIGSGFQLTWATTFGPLNGQILLAIPDFHLADHQ
jgi:hypothetical protein